jgi:hypothetical protein
METNQIAEARRYLDNAREILSEKANKLDGRYHDKKYVKMAGNTAYSGILVALDHVLGKKTRGRKNVEWYQEMLGKTDRKALAVFNNAYETLHISLGYEGNSSQKVASSGLENADQLIAWAEQIQPTSVIK